MASARRPLRTPQPGSTPAHRRPSPPSLLLPVAAALAWSLSAPPQAWAQPAAASTSQAAATVEWNLPAGALDDSLARIARQAQRSISADPALLAGKRAPAIRGSYSVEQAAQLALADSGLRLARTPQGTLTVLASAAAPAAPPATAAPGRAQDHALAEVKVVAQADRAGTTEGTGSYTARGPSGVATGLALSVRDTPQSVSVMTQQRMEDENLTSISDVLARVPGISTSALGTERSNANARGYPITNYQLDGVSTHTEFLGLDALPTQSIADMALYDRIEVLRGASGLTTGAGDPSGIVNMVRKKPTAQFQGSAEASVGSWGNRRGVLDLSSPLNASGSVRGRLVAVHQEGDSHIDFYSKKKDVLYGVTKALVESVLKRLSRLAGLKETGKSVCRPSLLNSGKPR